MARDASELKRDVSPGSGASDINHVRLVATVSTGPQRRSLPSGDQIVALGLAVRRPTGEVDAVPVQVGPAPPSGSRPRAGQIGRRVLAAAERLQVGDRVEVSGRLQRRWWSAGGARRSRVEVAAFEIEQSAE